MWVLWRSLLLWSWAPGLRIHYCQCQCVGYMSYSRLLDLRAEESRVLRHVNPQHYEEASRIGLTVSVSMSIAWTITKHFPALLTVFHAWQNKFLSLLSVGKSGRDPQLLSKIAQYPLPYRMEMGIGSYLYSFTRLRSIALSLNGRIWNTVIANSVLG